MILRPEHGSPRLAVAAALAGAVALAGAAALAARRAPAIAQELPIVRFVEGTVFTDPGQTVDMVVEVVGVADMAGYQATVRWDPSVLEYVDVEVLEDFLTATGRTIDYTPPVVTDDSVTLAAYTIPPVGSPVPGASGTGDILRVGLRARRSGRSELDIAGFLLVNTRNDPIASEVESGQVVVLGPALGPIFLPRATR